jgi:hypothetical protein
VRRGAIRRSLVSLVLGGALAVGAAGRAEAYVRSRDTVGNPVYWKSSCVPATIYTNGFEDAPGGLALDKIVKSISAAAHAWSPDEVTCPGTTDGHPNLEIVPTLAPVSSKPPSIGWDSRNAVVIRTDAWAKSGNPNIQGYAFDALAVTLVTSRGDGHIVDADIEVNAITQSWIDLDPGVTVSGSQSTLEPNDLQNALTHEFGHFLGLDHTCYTYDPMNPGKTRPLDDQGQPVPDCSAAPPSVAMTVMFDRAVPLQTSKRFLSDDDKRAVCSIYSAASPRSCELDQPADGCAVAPAQPGWGALSVGALACLVAGAARRRGHARA